eukprot:TRINITY_DN9518_c0_g1_i3.p1 TRINITY_DN9518_c0_g1~~TRINITY_DN9518_c0_g1_i3.p1  ORF type:complete len:120 (-),score=10.40 TRINITY_DN9518_c0_g1_i3:381-740(-)
MMNHTKAVVSIDACYDLDVYVSASKKEYTIRLISSNIHFLTVVPDLDPKLRYEIFRVIISARGYIIIQAKSAHSVAGKNIFMVYSINGENIVNKECNEFVNATMLDKLQYSLVNIPCQN